MQKIDRAALTKRAKISLRQEPEDRSYTDDFDDPETLAWIKNQLERGNDWAWCQVDVKAKLFDLEGISGIGGCSYENKQAFINGGYYESLVQEAVEELATKLEAIANEHDIWEHDRVSCIPCAAVST